MGDEKVTFHRIPIVFEHHDAETKKLTEKRQRQWLAKLNLKNVTLKKESHDHCFKNQTQTGHQQKIWVMTNCPRRHHLMKITSVCPKKNDINASVTDKTRS